MEVDIDEANLNCKTYMVDLAAYVRSIIKQCKTVRDIAVKLLGSIPTTYDTIYVMCDQYHEGSIKSAERISRGEGDRIILRNPEMKVPFDISRYLSVGKNKEELFKLIKRVMLDNTGNRTIYFCFGDCSELKDNNEIERPDLKCDHEEADTMLVAYASKISDGGVLVRSPSGDVDIVSLFVHHALAFNVHVYIDNGTGTQRKVLSVDLCQLSHKKRRSILGLHSGSGNDYLSSFFRKGKCICWKKMCAEEDFVDAFSSLGDSYVIEEEVSKNLERFVCSLYGKNRLEDVNNARSSIFWQRYNKSKKITELCMLPPCHGNLMLHLKRANYVAYIFKHANQLILNLDTPENHGWEGNSTQWMTEYFPSNINDILVDANEVVEEEDDDEEEDESYDIEEEDDADIEVEDYE